MSSFSKNVLVGWRLLKKILSGGCVQQTYGDSPHDPSPHHAEPTKTVASATTNNLLYSCCTDTHMLGNYMRMNFSPQYKYIWGEPSSMAVHIHIQDMA